TRSVALDLAPFGIRVNAVGPGAIMTEQFKAQDEAARRKRGATVPLGRGGEPDEVARVVAFMASDDASYVTGQILYVDGGMLAQVRNVADVERALEPLRHAMRTARRELSAQRASRA